MTSSPGNPAVLALAADLLFGSRIRAAAAEAGVEVELVRSADRLVVRAGEVRPALVLIDLEARVTGAVDAIRTLRAGGAAPTIVAFASHTDAESIGRARAAGADRVLARSAFVRELPTLLRAVRAGDDGGTG